MEIRRPRLPRHPFLHQFLLPVTIAKLPTPGNRFPRTRHRLVIPLNTDQIRTHHNCSIVHNDHACPLFESFMQETKRRNAYIRLVGRAHTMYRCQIKHYPNASTKRCRSCRASRRGYSHKTPISESLKQLTALLKRPGPRPLDVVSSRSRNFGSLVKHLPSGSSSATTPTPRQIKCLQYGNKFA